MKPVRTGCTQGGATRIRVLLPASFALTVCCFLLATIITEIRARGIEDAAESITLDASPSIQLLAEARSDLRQMEGLLVEDALRASPEEDTEDLVARIREAQMLVHHAWESYTALPRFQGEETLWQPVEAAMAAVDAATERILAARKLDPHARVTLLARGLRLAVDQLSDALLANVEFNARRSAELGATIAARRMESRSLATILDASSVVFAAIAGVTVAHVLKNYTAMIEDRLGEVERFADRVAHDIRSPLTAVSLALESMRRRAKLDAGTARMLDRASRSLQRVGQVVDGLLMLASAGKQAVADSRADLRAIVGGVIEDILPEAQAKDVIVEVQPLPAVSVACSSGALISILSNLIGNAIKYMGDSPSKHVWVRAQDLGANVHLEVEDTGPGVPLELRTHVFDPFVRATASSIPGLGLGLATVRRLVEAHLGTVGVEGGREGGSRFWVELPKVREEP